VIAIIGGGIAGLSAAYELATRGIAFVLLESSDRLGGLIRTDHADGFTIDAGADSMLVQKPAALQLCEELGLSDRLMRSTPPRTAYVHARGELHPLPAASLFGIPKTWPGILTYGLLPWSDRMDLFNRLRTGGAPPPSDGDEPVASFFRRRFGPATVDLIAQPLLGGIHAGDVERLSLRSVAPRLLDPSAFDLSERQPSAATSEGLFRALTGGMSELVAAIEGRVPAGSVHLRSRASQLARVEGERPSWRVETTGDALRTTAVIIAAPAHAAATLCASIDPELSALCGEIPYVSTASVALAWPRASIAHQLAGSGFVVAKKQSNLRITACTWVSSKWEHRAPAGAALLRAFLGSALDPDITSLPDDEIAAIAVRDLTAVLGITGPPTLTRVHRWIRAGAQHEVGHLARMKKIDARLTQLPGLFVAGSGFRAIGLPDCIADGRAAAAAAAHYVKIQEC